ncbi:MAG: hypothetical protein ACXW3R_13015 [Rhodoplanes sp.]
METVMPRELRKVIFSHNELQAALVNYLLHSGRSMPNRPIDRLEIAEGPALVTIFFQSSDPNEVYKWPLRQEEVAAALIRYCGQFNIPLPRAAKKRLQPDNGNLALIFSLDHRA